MAVKPLDDYKTFPRMAHWFNPILLFKLLGNVILSGVFGQYADRRLIVAALDTVPAEKHVERATAFKQQLEAGKKEGAIWIDFVADLGDGFDSTYAVATQLARDDLNFGEAVPRGQMLIMGGDEVYPTATQQAYLNQLKQPYKWALPDHNRDDDAGTPIFAIPGNHDWYDGLVLFLAHFCIERHVHIGDWRTQQRRSYFAIQLTDSIWLWAIDIQLADDLDRPQSEYFAAIAKAMAANSSIVLCSAEPGWLYTDSNPKSWAIMGYAIGIAHDAKKGLKIPLLLSGDTHHYSRYEGSDGTQFVTSGGGGAFLHPTHQLLPEVNVNWLNTQKPLKLGEASQKVGADPAVYPSMKTSRRLVWLNAFFALTNWDFSILMTVIYTIAGITVMVRDQWDTYFILAGMFAWGLMGYTKNQEKTWRWPVFLSSAIHSAVQVFAVIWSARYFVVLNAAQYPVGEVWYSGWLWLALVLWEMGLVGFFVGSTLFGLNMLVTCRWFRMNRNDAFSSLRIGDYNNFVRMKIMDDTIELFAIGMQNTPTRDEWISNPDYKKGVPDNPVFVAQNKIQPHLIEKIVIKTNVQPA